MQDSSRSLHQVLQNSAEDVWRKSKTNFHGRLYEREPGPSNFQQEACEVSFSSLAALLHEHACPCKKWPTNTQKQTADPFLAQPEPHQQVTAFETPVKPDPRGNASTEAQFSHRNCISTWKFLLAQIPGSGIKTSKPAKSLQSIRSWHT